MSQESGSKGFGTIIPVHLSVRQEEQQMVSGTVFLRGSLLASWAGLAMALSGASPRALADHFPRQPGIKILHYGFEVTLNDASDDLSVKDTIDFELQADGVQTLDLNLCNLIAEPRQEDRLNPCLQQAPRRPGAGAPGAAAAPAPTSVGRGMTVTAVEANGKALSYEHKNDVLRIQLPAAHAGDKLKITISYHGIPATGLNIGRNQYGDRGWFTDNWPNKARNWLATIDHISVKAPKTISVTAPSSYQVLSNGKMTEQTDLPGGMRRTTWNEALPIPPWQYSLAVAQYAVKYFGSAEGTEFSTWVFPQNADAGFNALDPHTASIFEFYSDHIGPFMYEKLAQLDATFAGGATEPATTIFYYNGAYGAESHEMAHQWFGDAVTESDWDDVWLAEGFATYFALLYTEHQDGRDAFLAGVKRARDSAVNYELAHPADTVVHANLENDSNVFSNSAQIYQGGAMVLHTLRGVLGDDNFWAGIRLYYSRFRNLSATSDDLRHAMEDACAESATCAPENRDLRWFFHEWLNRGGILKVSGTWHYDAAARQLEVTVKQTQDQGLFHMPIEIGVVTAPAPPAAPIAGGAGRRPGGAPAPKPRRFITLDKAETTMTIPLDEAPTDVQLDPGLWVPLMQATFSGN